MASASAACSAPPGGKTADEDDVLGIESWALLPVADPPLPEGDRVARAVHDVADADGPPSRTGTGRWAARRSASLSNSRVDPIEAK